MAITSDFHMHSSFSADSDASMEDMVKSAIRKGLKQICFTDHNDFDFPDCEEFSGDAFLLNVDSYLYELLRLKEAYADRIEIYFGIEIGLMQSCLRKNILLAKSHEFDFIIASSHVCRGIDPYYPQSWNTYDPKEYMRAYFEEMLENVKTYIGYDVYGHLDYIARYVPDSVPGFSYMDYKNLIDEILKEILRQEKAIELNTSGLRSAYKSTNPCKEIILRYKELGGEIITVGADAHRPEDIAAGFCEAESLLKECGFDYYATFEKRSPHMHRI